MNYWGLLGLPIGLFFICAGCFNWEWFFTRGRQKRAVDWFGRQNARILYGLLGVVVILMGLLSLPSALAKPVVHSSGRLS